MLSSGFETPLHLKRKPSRLLAGYLLCGHVFVLLAFIQALAIPVALHVVLWLLWAASIVYHLFRYWPYSYDTHAYWVWQAGGDWLRHESTETTVMHLKNVVQTPWFILVTLHAENASQRCLYFVDQLDAPTWRRLRVRLDSSQAVEACNSGERR